jgi:hypothetical protein
MPRYDAPRLLKAGRLAGSNPPHFAERGFVANARVADDTLAISGTNELTGRLSVINAIGGILPEPSYFHGPVWNNQ